MSHNPVFTYQVTIGEMTAIGTGNSKKQAKHAAARKLILIIYLDIFNYNNYSLVSGRIFENWLKASKNYKCIFFWKYTCFKIQLIIENSSI